MKLEESTKFAVDRSLKFQAYPSHLHSLVSKKQVRVRFRVPQAPHVAEQLVHASHWSHSVPAHKPGVV